MEISDVITNLLNSDHYYKIYSNSNILCIYNHEKTELDMLGISKEYKTRGDLLEELTIDGMKFDVLFDKLK